MSIVARQLSCKNFINLPNMLTYSRIAANPVILVLLMPPTSDQSLNIAFVVYILAAATDVLDGLLARRHNQVTSIGKLLDPLADKLLTAAVLIMLLALDEISAWLVFLIIGREIIITGLRSIAASRGLIIDANRMGKNKMVSQTIAILLLLLHIQGSEDILHLIGIAFLWLSIGLSYWSAVAYCAEFHREIKKLTPQ